MKIFSNDEIRAIEQQTIELEGITSLDLIERAAESIAAEIMALFRPNARILIFAGWGKNGADALEVTRLLMLQGYDPEVYFFNFEGRRLAPECALCRDRLLRMAPTVRLTEINGKERFQWPEPDRLSVVVDGLFGSGLEGKLPVSFQMLIRNINQSGATVIAIDVPSGLFGEWNSQTSRENIIHANLTLAIGFPRLSFFIEDNDVCVGRWKVIDIGLNADVIRNSPYTYYLVEKADVRRCLPVRGRFASKRDFGHALLAAGSYGMSGAAILAAGGALRSGAGKVSVHAPRCACIPLQTAVPSAMYDRDGGENAVTAVPTDSRYTAVGVGPGLGTSDATVDALEMFFKAMSAAARPIVIDADALNAIAKRPALMNYIPALSVLTPHAGEFDRLFGDNATSEARLSKAIDLSRYHNVIIVLKGRYTAIVRPDGRVFFNSSGTPALATPGSGDVLTGVITAFMAQGIMPELAAMCATYIHGKAGELAAEVHGEYGVTASDIVDNIGRAINVTIS